MDVHEILVSRGDVQSATPRVKLKIHDPRNCGFVHSHCHKPGIGGERMAAGIRYLMRYEGIQAIRDFLQDLPIDLGLIGHKLRAVDATFYELLAHEQTLSTG